jgi:hypothetical protein
MQTGNTLVVVDVQPQYAEHCVHLMPKFVAEVTKRIRQGDEVLLTVNVPDLSGDSDDDIADFWVKHGLDESCLDRLIRVPKTYAFLRGWMDNGVPDEEIVATLRALRKAGVSDTRSISDDELEAIAPEGSQYVSPLFLPDELEYSDLAHLSSMDICGGYREECLREVELWLESRGNTYRRLEHLVY